MNTNSKIYHLWPHALYATTAVAYSLGEFIQHGVPSVPPFWRYNFSSIAGAAAWAGHVNLFLTVARNVNATSSEEFVFNTIERNSAVIAGAVASTAVMALEIGEGMEPGLTFDNVDAFGGLAAIAVIVAAYKLGAHGMRKAQF